MNTAERAWVKLQVRYALPRTSFSFQIKRKIAPAGTVSDGTRVLTVEPCPRFRWILARNGAGEILAEVDQRAHHDDPGAMLAAFDAKLDALEAAYSPNKLGDLAPPIKTELTPTGEQFVIPGCERDDPRTGAKQMNLF